MPVVYTSGNNINTSLTSGITSGATTIPVASTANFPTIPSGWYLPLTIIDPPTPGSFEIVYVTAVSGLNLTVLRGQEGSTAQAWVTNDTIFSETTAGTIKNFNTVIQYNEYCYGGNDTGSGNSYVVALTPAVTSYVDGMLVSFNPTHANTGAATLNAGGGAYSIHLGGSALQGGEINGVEVMCQWNADVSLWQIIGGNVLNNSANNYVASDTGSANAYVIALSPAITTYVDGMQVSFKPAHSNTASSTLNAGGGAKTIQMANANLQGGEIVAGVTLQLQYSATNSVWEIIGGAVTTQVGAATTATQAPQWGQIQSGSASYAASDTGSANAYVIALSPTISAYTDGMVVSFKPAHSNTASSTLNAGGGAKTIQMANANLQGGEIVAGVTLQLQYSATNSVWEIIGGAVTTQVGAATASGHATNLGQLQNNTITLSPAAATTATQAAQLGQVQSGSTNYAASDTGSTNAYVIALSPAITSYTDGMVVSFKPASTNTGSATLNAGGGAATLAMAGAFLQGGEIVAGVLTTVQYSSNSGHWLVQSALSPQVGTAAHSGQATNLGQLQNNTITLSPAAATTATQAPQVSQIQSGALTYQANDTGSANAYVIALSPTISSYTDGMIISFNATNSNTGASTLNAGGGAKAIQMAGVALQGGEIVANQSIVCQYNSTTTAWDLIGGNSTAQVAVPTASGHAVNLTYAQAHFAALAGSSSQAFSTANLSVNGVVTANCHLAAEGTSGFNGTFGYSFIGDGNYDTGMFSPSDGLLDFYTNSNLALALNAAGSATLHWNGNSTTYMAWQTDNNVVIYIGGTALWASGTNSSDMNLKQNIIPTAMNGLNTLAKLEIVDYQWKPTVSLADGGKVHTGLVAQAVQTICPDAIHDAGPNLLLDKTELVPILIKALQELNTVVQSQATEIAALKEKVGIA